tara:strand:+ start:134 stop:304 length:171 start_codon:yes stop_codon:yes gene_type:complete
MKNKIILIMLITIYSSITTPLFKENIPNSLNISERNIEIAIAEDLWDYFSRFRINN